jgi:hemolysin D
MRLLTKHLGVLSKSLELEREREKTARPFEHTDFLPGALEILETPPNPLGRAILWTLLAFLMAALVWAALGQIDVVAAAQGKVIPRGRVRIVQAADLGVVTAIHVVDGAAVSAGQPLVVLDPTAADADAAQARQSLSVAEIDRARALALVDAANGGTGAFAVPDGTVESSAVTQRALVAARVGEHRTAVAVRRQERQQRQSEMAMVAAEIKKLEEQLPLAEEQLAAFQSLDGDGLVPRQKVAEVKERVVGLRQDLVIRREELGKTEAALAGVGSEITKLENEFRAQSLDALTEAEANYLLRAEEVKKAEDRVSLTVLTSPIDGTVTQLAVHTLGAVVRPADALLAIVPREEELLVEAMVLNKDIGFVQEGQRAEVKLEAFPFTRYGVVEGTVETVSRDSIEHEQLGLVFPALVKLSQSYVSIGAERVDLAAGFAATAEIKTGRRRIIEFLLSPLSRRLQEAGRER